MRLKYKILWFEDNESWYTTARRNLNDFLEENGFAMVADRYSNNDEGIREILSKHDYDLILMDLNLDGVQGDKIIEDIRMIDLYKEIIFYSQNDVRSIRATIQDKGIDGIYCTSRNNEEFEEKVTKIIKNTIKKVQDVNNMRGLVIAETIDLESKIKSMLTLYFAVETGALLDDRRLGIYTRICEKKREQFERERVLIDEIQSSNMESLLDNEILTSANLFQALQTILKEDLRIINEKLGSNLEPDEKVIWEMKKAENQALKEQLNKYEDEIIKLRNTLAHVTEKINEAGMPYLETRHRNGTNIIFDNDKYIEIRKKMRDHSENLERIHTSLFIDRAFIDEAAAST